MKYFTYHEIYRVISDKWNYKLTEEEKQTFYQAEKDLIQSYNDELDLAISKKGELRE